MSKLGHTTLYPGLPEEDVFGLRREVGSDPTQIHQQLNFCRFSDENSRIFRLELEYFLCICDCIDNIGYFQDWGCQPT